MAIIDIVGLYLDKETFEPMVYGRNDCCLFPANLAVELTGLDPAEPFRGKYGDEVGAQRFCQEVGGLPILIDRAFRNVGFKKIDEPKTGDCGCVHVDGEAVGAIFYKTAWFIKADFGVVALGDKHRVLAIWNVAEVAECRR